MWVDGEGKDGATAIKVIDNNGIYSFPHRQMSVFNNGNESLASKGISHGDFIRATWDQKSNASKYIGVRLKYTPYFSELEPILPPMGFTGSWSEIQPIDPPDDYVPFELKPTAAPEGFNVQWLEEEPTEPPDGFNLDWIEPLPNTPPDGYHVPQNEAMPTSPPDGYIPITNPMNGTLSNAGEWFWQTFGGGTSGE